MACVHIEQGTVRGCGTDKYIAYEGIPYAKPPIGELRFKAPEPPEKWLGVRDAKKHGPVCPQFDAREQCFEDGDEDCLYINVYTPRGNDPHGAPCPVMVWIHGGAFYTGSGNSDFYGPDFLVSQQIILVTFNYRLRVFGFLCLNNEEVPGNAGLKDQVLALRWVRRNIAAFGGDCSNITIFGCGAGSASVSYHMVSPLSVGLFDKAICQSGVCLNDWSYGLDGRERAFVLAAKLGKITSDENEVLTFLRSVPAKSLVTVAMPKKSNDVADAFNFGPVVEKILPNSTPFLSEHALDRISKNAFMKVPLMIGYTSGDGLELIKYDPQLRNKSQSYIEMNVPRELKLKWSTERINNVSKLVLQHYLDSKSDDSSMKSFVDLETDLHFSYNIMRFAGIVSRECPVYFYKWVCETSLNQTKKHYQMEHLYGCCHTDDLHYLFKVKKMKKMYNSKTIPLITKIVQMWTNFAKTGCPTPPDAEVPWLRFSEAERNYLIIDKEFRQDVNPDHDRFTFWRNIYDNICDCPFEFLPK